MEAELAKGFLKAHSIESYIKADDAGEMYPQLGSIAGLALVVTQKDREKAKKLLKTRR